MALAQVRFSHRIRDEEGIEASYTSYGTVDDASTVAAVLTDMDDLGQALDLVTGGVITNAEVHFQALCTGCKGAPVAGDWVEKTANFNFGNVANPKRFGEALPALRQSKIVGGVINLADADVAALISIYATGTAVTTYTTAVWQALTALRDAFISFRKRRRALHSRTIEV